MTTPSPAAPAPADPLRTAAERAADAVSGIDYQHKTRPIIRARALREISSILAPLAAEHARHRWRDVRTEPLPEDNQLVEVAWSVEHSSLEGPLRELLPSDDARAFKSRLTHWRPAGEGPARPEDPR